MTPAELRHSLFNPPNAVVDTGIDLKRKYAGYRPYRSIQWRMTRKDDNTIWNARLRKLLGEISEGLNTSIVRLKGQKRTWPLVQYRQAAYCIMCRFSGYSPNHIAAGFNRDHTCVSLGIRKMAPHMAAVAAELPADAPPIEWARAMKRRIAP